MPRVYGMQPWLIVLPRFLDISSTKALTEITSQAHTYYFLTSLNFPDLSFKRQGAKEASFLEIKFLQYFKVAKK